MLPTATTAQAADSDLTVSVTLSVYNKGSVGHALEVYDRTKQIDEGKCKSFSNGNNDYRIEFAQGDNFTRCSIFPPFEGPENAGKYYSLDDKGEFIFVYSSEQLMQETEFLGRPRDIGYISIRPLVFDLDSASAGAKFTDYWANRRDDSKYTPVEQIVLWNKPDGKVAVHGKKTDAYQGNATVAAQYSTPVSSFEPLTPAPTDPAAPDRNRTASASKSGSLLGSISSTTWIIAAAVAGGLVVLAGIVFFVLRGRSRKADTPAKSQRQQAREEARAAKRQAREDRKRAKSGATASAPMSQEALPLGGPPAGSSACSSRSNARHHSFNAYCHSRQRSSCSLWGIYNAYFHSGIDACPTAGSSSSSRSGVRSAHSSSTYPAGVQASSCSGLGAGTNSRALSNRGWNSLIRRSPVPRTDGSTSRTSRVRAAGCS